MAIHIGLQLGLIILVFVGGLFLYRHTGLGSALWLSLYLAATLLSAVFQPILTKGWMDLLGPLWQSGQEFLGRDVSLATTMQGFSYLLSLPQAIATFLVALLVIADIARLLQRLGIKTGAPAFSPLLSIQKRSVMWGCITLFFCCALSPLLAIALTHYLAQFVQEYPGLF